MCFFKKKLTQVTMIKINKKKFILVCLGGVFLYFAYFILFCLNFTYFEKTWQRHQDGSQTFWIQAITHKLINPKGEYKISLNGEAFYIYYSPGYKHKKKKGTLVILPSYSYFDHKDINKKYIPHKDFKVLVDNLNKNFKVVVIEYYGYNNSDDTKRLRTAENICEEIHTALHLLGIKKYILMPHSISGLYAMHYINKYPEEVDRLIGIDITLPYYFLEECDSNDKFLEHKFNDEGKKMPEAYVNMYTYFWETAKNLEKFKFPQTLPVTLFTSTGLIKYIDKEIEEKILKTRVEDYLNSMITNNNIQKIHVLEGTHYLHDSQYKNMSEIIKQNLFLGNKK